MHMSYAIIDVEHGRATQMQPACHRDSDLGKLATETRHCIPTQALVPILRQAS